MRMKISEIKINPGRRDTQQRNVEELARSIAARLIPKSPRGPR